jgi:hypothetical protein
MKAWILALIVTGNPEHYIGEYESIEACGRAGHAVLTAATEAYGKLSPALVFRCTRKD